MDIKLFAILMKKIKASGGKDGKNGATFTPTVSDDGTLSWENDGELPNPKSVNIQGKEGKVGTTFTPSVSEDGVLSWENDGDKENPSSVNIKGKDGKDGDKGKDGADGESGATFTPSVSADGVLSWNNDKELPNPESVNIKGQDGKDGKDGKNGSPGEQGDAGVSVTNVAINDKHHLICTMSDGTEIDAGEIAMLPDVTEANEGKIMKVVNGKWTLASDSNDDDVSVLKVEQE